MTIYKVPFDATVSTYITVEADSLEEAVDAAYLEGVPALMHIDHTYPDVSDWEVPEWFYEENPELD